ncbi:MAG: M56 family metallopeptidase [Candidatus Acidiferrales bacterium]
MTSLTNWFSPEILRPLGWALVHFLWQGLALAALLSASLAICRRATTRYALSVAALALMIAAPAVTFMILVNRSAPASTLATGTPSTAMVAMRSAVSTVLSSASAATREPAPADALLWFVEAWLAGVIFFSLRAAGGLLLIERLRRKDATPVHGELREMCAGIQRRLNLNRTIRFCESRVLEAPAVIGWFRPVVMLPVTALTGLTEEQLKAVIAHELAHIRRLDCFVNLFQIAAETLLFYHPAIWWVSRRIRAERENCCDDVAISVCGDAVGYARALAQMEERRAAPSLAMAANRGPLMGRVARMLGVEKIHSGIRSPEFAVSFVFLAGALLAGGGFAGVSYGSFVPNAFTGGARVASASANLPQTLNESERRPVLQPSPARRPAASMASAAEQQSQEQTQDQRQTTQSNSNKNESYIDGLKSAGLDNLTADQLIALKVQGVTSEYVRAMHDLGLKPSIDELIGMKVQGVTPDYIRDMRSLGLDMNIDRIIGMKVQGITPDYVREIRALGLKPSGDELVGMKIQGVTPDYVREMRALDLNLTIEQLVGMNIQGVTPNYVREIRALGLEPSTDELVGMKIQGVTPDYVREMRALGLNLTIEQLVGMKIQGVTPDYVREIRALGLKPSGDELVGMKIQGVTPDYVRDMRAAGLNATIDQIVGMRIQGVTPEYVKALRATGMQDFKDDADNYTAAKIHGITPEFIEKVRSHGIKDLDLDKLIQLKNADIF